MKTKIHTIVEVEGFKYLDELIQKHKSIMADLQENAENIRRCLGDVNMHFSDEPASGNACKRKEANSQ